MKGTLAMPNGDDTGLEWVHNVSSNLGTVFRHLLPGILIIGAAYVSHPSWFSVNAIDTHSWQHIVLIAIVAVALGNTWFAVNRYGVHQILDYCMYLARFKGPARGESRLKFHDEPGTYVARSLCDAAIPPLARQHVAFRASSVLLLYTVAELGFLAYASHEPNTFFEKHASCTLVVSISIFLVAIWQGAITRFVDYHVVTYADNSSPRG
jgi:hypothetical protein